jgi:3-isopropylmalate/(R)-2-methylmalate dehydratase small subunit
MTIRGSAHKYETNVDTDAIIPARYLCFSDAAELGRHCMEDVDPEFRKRVRPGDIIVARTNYGCGSAREHAPVALKSNGIACVVADSFARIFFRNSINLALPLVECAAAAEATEMGDDIEVDFDKGEVINHTRQKRFSFSRYPDFMMDIVNAGGLIEFTRKTA